MRLHHSAAQKLTPRVLPAHMWPLRLPDQHILAPARKSEERGNARWDESNRRANPGTYLLLEVVPLTNCELTRYKLRDGGRHGVQVWEHGVRSKSCNCAQNCTHFAEPIPFIQRATGRQCAKHATRSATLLGNLGGSGLG